MAKKLIPFEISLSGVDGGTADFPISINDPMWGARDDITNQRMRFLYQGSDPLTIEQQRLLQALENQAGISHQDVIISDDERESPFPIGCPSGFFQEGNVCVPIIGTYPDETYNAPPAGQNFARGVIDHIEVPPNIVAGQVFTCKVFIRNIGAIRGKFGIGLIVDTWNIDVTSPQGWVPRFTPAVVEVKATCPTNAVLGNGTIPATFELQKLDEVSREYTIDDVANQNLPQPNTNTPIPPTTECFTYNSKQYCLTTNPPTGGDCITIGTKTYCVAAAPQPQCFTFNGMNYCETSEITSPNCIQIGSKIYCPTTEVTCPTGQEKVNGICVPVCPSGSHREGGVCVPNAPPQCITIGGVQFCQSDTWKTGCIFQNGKIYCINNPPPPPPPPEEPAVIMAPSSARDGDSFDVKGYKFKPGERVDIILTITWQSDRDEYDGKKYSLARYEIADSSGSWKEQMKTSEVPSGVSGNAIIRAIGVTSGKLASTTVSIL